MLTGKIRFFENTFSDGLHINKRKRTEEKEQKFKRQVLSLTKNIRRSLPKKLFS